MIKNFSIDGHVVDFRPVKIEMRDVRGGNARHSQSRSGRVNDDGSIDFCEWWTISTISNYGDCFDKRLGVLGRFLNWLSGKE